MILLTGSLDLLLLLLLLLFLIRKQSDKQYTIVCVLVYCLVDGFFFHELNGTLLLCT
jgi:hypothetical protein